MAEQGLKEIDIKGKPYVEVNERLKFFRGRYPEYSLISEIIKLEDGICLMKASVIDRAGVCLATGHAREKEGSTFINKTSYIENCETSAWGRALGNFGIGIETSVASAEEVGNAVKQRNAGGTAQPPKTPPAAKAPAKIAYVTAKQYADLLKVGAGMDLNKDEVGEVAAWYRKSDKMTAAEAASLIKNWDSEFNKFLDTREQKQAEPQEGSNGSSS